MSCGRVIDAMGDRDLLDCLPSIGKPASTRQVQGTHPGSTSTVKSNDIESVRACLSSILAAFAHRRTRGRAACTKNALVHPIELLSVLNALVVFSLLGRVVVLQERLDRLVLLVELRHVRDEILDDVHWRKEITSMFRQLKSARYHQASGKTYCEAEGKAWKPWFRFDRYERDRPRC